MTAARCLFGISLAAGIVLSLAYSASARDQPIVNGDTGRALDEYLSRLERFGFAGGALAV